MNNQRGQIQTIILAAAAVCIIAVIVTNVLPVMNINSCQSHLEGLGYTVIAKADYDELDAKLDSIAALALAANNAAVLAADRVALFNENVEYIYPGNTSTIVLMTAPATANTWSAWGNITGNDTTALSDCFTGHAGYLSEITLHSYNYADSRLIVEIATDALGVNTVGRVYMFTDFTYMIKFHSAPIAMGSQLYYRVMCSHVDETVQARFKYYYN